MSHESPRVFETSRALTANEFLGVGPMLSFDVILVRSSQLVNQLTFFAFVIDFLRKVHLLMNQEPFPRAELLTAETIDLRQTIMHLTAVSGQQTHFLEFQSADVTNEAKKKKTTN